MPDSLRLLPARLGLALTAGVALAANSAAADTPAAPVAQAVTESSAPPSGPNTAAALEQFLADVYWGDPDYLLIDMPPGTGDIALSLAQYLPRGEVFVVTTPQPAAQEVASLSAAMAAKSRPPGEWRKTILSKCSAMKGMSA